MQGRAGPGNLRQNLCLCFLKEKREFKPEDHKEKKIQGKPREIGEVKPRETQRKKKEEA